MKKFGDLEVSEEFSRLVPPMSKENFELLTDNIRRDGYIRDPLVIWKGKNIILDGHHRYKIAEKLGMGFRVEEMDFKSVFEAQMWIAENQSGQRRLTRAQLAVFALGLLPAFSAIGKKRQSRGGRLKGKGEKDKPFNAMDEASSLAGVGVNMVKDLQKIEKEVEFTPFVEMIRCEFYDLTVAHVKSLIKRKKRGDFAKMFISDTELTKEAAEALNLIQHPKSATVTEKAVKATKEAVKEVAEAAKKLEDGTEAEQKAEVLLETATEAAAEAVKAEKAAKIAEAAGDKVAKKAAEAEAADAAAAAKVTLKALKTLVDKENKPSGGGGGEEDGNKSSTSETGLIKGSIDKVMEEDVLKRYVKDIKEKIHETFKGKVSAMAVIDNPANLVSTILNDIIENKPETDLHPDKVLIVPTRETNTPWFQEATCLSSFYCDSNEHPIRILYYGENLSAYFDELVKYGITSAYILSMSEVKSVAAPKAKQISATAFAMSRKGKKAKMPSAKELLKRAKSKK